MGQKVFPKAAHLWRLGDWTQSTKILGLSAKPFEPAPPFLTAPELLSFGFELFFIQL